MITRIRKPDFTKRRFDEKSHPYVYKNVCDLNDQEMWKSLVSIGKDRGPFASLARHIAPDFNLMRKTVEERGDIKINSRRIQERDVFDWGDWKEYEATKNVVRKMLTLAKHCEVW